VRGVVGAHEELAARVGETMSGAREVSLHGGEVVPLVVLEAGGHRQDRKRDLGMLVGTQPPARLAHHLQEAEPSPVGTVGQDPYVQHRHSRRLPPVQRKRKMRTN
jgi:hypothetical protein